MGVLGTGTTEEILKMVDTMDWLRDRLKMSVDTPASWSAQALSTWLGMPSGGGPEALQGFTFLLACSSPCSQ